MNVTRLSPGATSIWLWTSRFRLCTLISFPSKLKTWGNFYSCGIATQIRIRSFLISSVYFTVNFKMCCFCSDESAVFLLFCWLLDHVEKQAKVSKETRVIQTPLRKKRTGSLMHLKNRVRNISAQKEAERTATLTRTSPSTGFLHPCEQSGKTLQLRNLSRLWFLNRNQKILTLTENFSPHFPPETKSFTKTQTAQSLTYEVQTCRVKHQRATSVLWRTELKIRTMTLLCLRQKRSQKLKTVFLKRRKKTLICQSSLRCKKFRGRSELINTRGGKWTQVASLQSQNSRTRYWSFGRFSSQVMTWMWSFLVFQIR